MRGWDALTTERLCKLTGRHPTTVRRWLRTNKFPPWVAKLQELAADLGEIERAWRGWALRCGELVSPEGWRFTPADVRSIPFLRAHIEALQIERFTHLQADWVDRRFVESVAEPARRVG
jgi:transcriptional regulator with XRE-family HTH domain